MCIIKHSLFFYRKLLRIMIFIGNQTNIKLKCKQQIFWENWRFQIIFPLTRLNNVATGSGGKWVCAKQAPSTMNASFCNSIFPPAYQRLRLWSSSMLFMYLMKLWFPSSCFCFYLDFSLTKNNFEIYTLTLLL